MLRFFTTTGRLGHDFAAPGPSRRRGVALAAGLVIAGLAAFALQERLAMHTAETAADQATPAVAPTKRAAEDPAEPLRRRLALPWGEILNGIDRAVPKQVVLLGVDPDVEKGRVRIVAEARHAEAMSAFVTALDATPAFSSTYLASHEVRQDDPQRPLRFTVDLRWAVRR